MKATLAALQTELEEQEASVAELAAAQKETELSGQIAKQLARGDAAALAAVKTQAKAKITEYHAALTTARAKETDLKTKVADL